MAVRVTVCPTVRSLASKLMVIDCATGWVVVGTVGDVGVRPPSPQPTAATQRSVANEEMGIRLASLYSRKILRPLSSSHAVLMMRYSGFR